MATLSRKTIGTAMRAIELWSRATIEQWLYEMDVPNRFAVGDSKMKLLLNVFKSLEQMGQQDLILRLILDAATRLPDDRQAKLQAALIRDGYVVADGQVAIDVPVAEEDRSALELLVERNEFFLDQSTLTHHLKETTALFRQEKWDSAIGHARNFVEQLLSDIAGSIAAARSEKPDLSRPVLIRKYLEHAGFFDKAEREKLADGVYAFFSEEGSHPGISSQSAARVCMHVLWAFGYYVLEKFEDWRASNDL